MGQIDPYMFFIDMLTRHLVQQVLTMIVWVPVAAGLLYLHAKWTK